MAEDWQSQVNPEPYPWETETPQVRECCEPDCKNKVIDGYRCNQCKDKIEPVRGKHGIKWDLASMQAQLKAWANEARLKKTASVELTEKAVIEAMF